MVFALYLMQVGYGYLTFHAVDGAYGAGGLAVGLGQVAGEGVHPDRTLAPLTHLGHRGGIEWSG